MAQQQPNSKLVECPEEFMSMCSRGTRVNEHRLVVAKILKRPLLKCEIVTRFDNDVYNVAPENLIAFANRAEWIQYQMGKDVTPIFDGRLL